MDDEQLRALEAAEQELRHRVDDPEAADAVRAAAAAEFVERRAAEARQLVVRCREILLGGGIPPDTTVTVTVGSLTDRPPIWDSARDPMLRCTGWDCDPHDPSRRSSTPRLVLPQHADTMIGAKEDHGPDEGRDTAYELFTDEELARHLGDGSLTYSLTALLLEHELSWASARARSPRLIVRLRPWWGAAPP